MIIYKKNFILLIDVKKKLFIQAGFFNNYENRSGDGFWSIEVLVYKESVSKNVFIDFCLFLK